MRVLLTEDDEVPATVAIGLRREGMVVAVAHNGAAALEYLRVNRYDVVVLDRDLPGVHSDDICRALAADRSETRVLMLTRGEVGQGMGRGLGGDDYLLDQDRRYQHFERGGEVQLQARIGVQPGQLTIDQPRPAD